MLSLAAFTGTKNNPSSRFRIRQYKDQLMEQGIQVTDYISYFDTFAPDFKLIRPFWAISNIMEHYFQVQRGNKCDVAFVQREMLATLYTVERLIKIPVILDVDDAIFMMRNGAAARKLAMKADCVVCGNTYLSNWFSQFNRNVKIINTGVNTDYFRPGLRSMNRQIIGWAGSSSGFTYLYSIESALKIILEKYPESVLRIVADKAPDFKTIDLKRIEYIKWTADNEVEVLQDLSVGIMPLDDNAWTRGKCSFKMLTYMACAVPVVASPVGMNCDVLSNDVGKGAVTVEDWVESISFFLDNPHHGQVQGLKGRQLVENKFSHHIISSQLAEAIKSLI